MSATVDVGTAKNNDLLKACVYSTYIGAGIAASVMILIGFITILTAPAAERTKGLFLIILACAVAALAYWGAESTCLARASGQINSFMPTGIKINLK